MPILTLQTPVDDIFMVGPLMAHKLKKLEITTVEDLLRHYPRRYQDFTLISKISTLQKEEVVTIKGNITAIKNIYTKNGKKIQTAEVKDETGTLSVVWYNQPYLIKIIKVGTKINLSGKINIFKNKPVMESPEYEIDKPINIHTGRLVPIYPETYGISSKWLRSRIAPILRQVKPIIPEFLPEEIIRKYNFLPENEAIKQIHFPLSQELQRKAFERLAFDELFLVQLASLIRKKEWQQETVGHRFDIASHKKKLNTFISSLPFSLTNAQNRAVSEILTDLGKKTPMNRLLQGEVGSGKTVVATIAMFITFCNKFKSLMMAPTEILAKQHYETIEALVKPFGIKVALITGSSKPKPTTGNVQPNNSFDIFIGTHALLSEKFSLKNLGLVVIDEQQRFGVEQRAKLKGKGINPHLLTATATPIPRTMALTLYGELEVSHINELPKDRKQVKTYVVPLEKRGSAYKWIEEKIRKTNNQAFIICPFIEESETLATVKAAKTEFETLQKNIFPNLRLGLLHGKLKTKDKEKVITKFKNQEYDVLVTTPIVEVGIDIPNTTIMMIEGGERFGLTQLHQLRGRVGRGSNQGYCLLFSENTSKSSLTRLKALEKIFVGAELSELDLRLRGPGDMFGVRQHGVKTSINLKIASLSDSDTIERTKFEAERILQKNTLAQSGPLHQALEKYTIKTISQD